jgi:NADH-quinone oxidoreductase subunit M
MELINQHVLTFLIFFPLITAFAALVSPSIGIARIVAMGGAVLTFLGSLHVWYYFNPSSVGLQFSESYAWLPDYGIRYIVGIDGLNLLLVMLTTFLTILVLISIWHLEEPRQRAFLALIMALESMMLGALVAVDFVFFYFFWEMMLIPMYFMIGLWGGKRRIYATTKFFIYTVVGSLLMLAAALVMYHLYSQQFGQPSTSLLDLYKLDLAPDIQLWLFLAFAFAFAIKVPMWPLHTWLPDAHVEAPTTGSVILAGVLLKMGTYGFLRFAIPLFPEAAAVCAPYLMGLGIVGIIYGALVAWMQTDAKKLVAYSSVSHLGFVVVGSVAVVAGGASLSTEALTGAVYQMVNHGISTGALFFLVGIIYERRHTRMLKDFGGLAAVMPWFAIMLIIATLSSVGLPGTGGFVGEFLILLGTFQVSPFAGVLASLGVLLGAIYMLTLCKAILFGPLENEENKQLKDLSPREFAYLLPLAFLAIVMGIFPGFFLDKIRPSIEHLAKNYKTYSLTVDANDHASEAVVTK